MERAKNISKSMIAYLKRAREYKEFIIRETKEYERGKRHLANMMGVEADGMTQRDVDDAIKYLLPSGLFDRRAKPIMRHPDLLYPVRKGAQFDASGRPNHFLFYTSKPNYFQALSDIGKHERALNQYEDEQLALGIIEPPQDARYAMSAKEWISYEEASKRFLEPITSEDFEYLIISLERLRNHPYSDRASKFFDTFTNDKPDQTLSLYIPDIHKDEKSGQIYAETITRHREHKIRVRTILNGSGKIDIMGNDILYFEAPYMRRALLFPLTVSNMLDKVDVIATGYYLPRNIGVASIAAAVRYSVSVSIAAFVDEQTREKMRLSGLLTFDFRQAERKKFGQEGARRKYTWKKR